MYNTWIVNTPICDFFKFIWKSASQSKHPKNVVTIGSTPDVCSKKLSLAQLQLYPMIIGTPGNTYASFMGVQFFPYNCCDTIFSFYVDAKNKWVAGACRFFKQTLNWHINS